MKVSQPWLGWAEQDVCAPTWPIWCGLAVTLWGAAGLLLALVVFRLGGESLGAGTVLFVVGVYGFVIALAVVMAHTELGRRMAIERMRRGWRAQPWSLAITLLVLVWLVVWFLSCAEASETFAESANRGTNEVEPAHSPDKVPWR